MNHEPNRDDDPERISAFRAHEEAGALEVDDLQIDPNRRSHLAQAAADFGWNVRFINEPDGTIRWMVFSEEGDFLQGGLADDWDDARIDAIADLHPPSDE